MSITWRKPFPATPRREPEPVTEPAGLGRLMRRRHRHCSQTRRTEQHGGKCSSALDVPPRQAPALTECQGPGEPRASLVQQVQPCSEPHALPSPLRDKPRTAPPPTLAGFQLWGFFFLPICLFLFPDLGGYIYSVCKTLTPS